MPKSQIVSQFLSQLSRYDTTSRRRLLGHMHQEVSMPLGAYGNLLVESFCNRQKDVLQTIVERM
jgi:hypothetical protein